MYPAPERLRCNFILGAYFFPNNKTNPPYIVAKSDNEQYVAARCRHHGSDLHASFLWQVIRFGFQTKTTIKSALALSLSCSGDSRNFV